MKLNKVVFLFLLPFLAELLTACLGCPEPPGIPYAYCSISLQSLDNSGTVPIESTQAPIKKEAFGIRLRLSLRENMCEAKPPKALFLPTALASSGNCSDVPHAYIRNRIMAVSVFSIYDFATDKPAGAEVSDLFFIYRPDKLHNEFTPLANIAQPGLHIPFSPQNPAQVYDLLLMSPPALGTQHKFLVNVLLSDGNELVAETELTDLVP